MTDILLTLYGAHLVGDVIFYAPWFSSQKRAESLAKKVLATVAHCFIHAALIVLLFFIFNLGRGYLAAAIIFCFHFAIDWSRMLLEKRLIRPNDFLILERKKIFDWLLKRESGETSRFMGKYFSRWLVINVFDQTLHVIAILACAWLVRP